MRNTCMSIFGALLFFNVACAESKQAETTLYIKPFKEFKFTNLYVCVFNPYYSTYERLSVIPVREDGFYKFSITNADDGFYRIENDEGMGIGRNLYIQQGDKVFAEYAKTKTDIIFKIRGENSGNNTLLQNIYPTIVTVDRIVKSNSIEYLKAEPIFKFVDSLYFQILRPKIEDLKKVEPITQKYEYQVLKPQMAILREYFINILLHKNNLIEYFEDSIYQHPNYKLWSTQTLENSYFRNYLKAKILINKYDDLSGAITRVKQLFLREGDSVLIKVAMANCISIFWESFKGGENTESFVRTTDSLISLYNWDKRKMNLPMNIFNTASATLPKDLDNIIYTSLKTNQDISILKIISDTSKIYFLDHWASWCSPCIKELPYVKRLSEQFGDRLKVVYLSKDNNIRNCLKVLASDTVNLENAYILNYKETMPVNYEALNADPALPVYQLLYFKRGKIYVKRTTYPSDESVSAAIQSLLLVK